MTRGALSKLVIVFALMISLPTCDRNVILGGESAGSSSSSSSEANGASSSSGSSEGNADAGVGNGPVCGDGVPEGENEQCDERGGTQTCTVNCQFRNRVTDGLILLYTFEEGSGDRIFDRSGFGAPLNLTIADPQAIIWGPGSIELASPVLIPSDAPATKLTTAVRPTAEFSVEAWVHPANLEQDGPARIVTVSNSQYGRNFLLAQNQTLAIARARTTDTDINGYPELETGDLLETQLTHLVFTHGTDGTELIFVDGIEQARRVATGDLSTWDDSYHLALGAEFNEELESRDFLGTMYLIAMYSRALSVLEIAQNFADGP